MKAKKSLGQYFLKDPKILKKIVDFAQIEGSDTVLEIGPGEGSLTKFLVDKAERVIAIEKDCNLAEHLSNKFRKEITDNRLQIIEDDILNYNPPSTVYKLVGNIPYNITGEIFRNFLQIDNKPQSITFVIQKEVAERIMARDQKESILSISVKVFGTPEFGGVIKAGSFSPVPKVDSAIIAVRNISNEKIRNLPAGRQEFFEILKRGFSHKRKLLIKNLGATKEIFEKCGIPEKARAEDLRVTDWVKLAGNL